MSIHEQMPSFRSISPSADLAGTVERVTSSVGASVEPEEKPSPQSLVACAADVQDGLASSLPGLDFSVHVSARYHARRCAWYDRLHRVMMLVIATGSSAGVAAIFGGLLRQAEYLSVAVALAGVLELAYSLPERARLEDALYRRFNALAADIAAASQVGLGQLRRWEAQRLLIRSDADDRLEALRRICHNLEAEARGYPAETRYLMRPWQRLMAQILSLPPLRPLPAAGRYRAEP
jgi:hypothetical protein